MPDGLGKHGMQEARGSSPLSSTYDVPAGQMLWRLSDTGDIAYSEDLAR